MYNRIMFLRDQKGHPCGCLAIKADRNNKSVAYQLSVLNPKDRFRRDLARDIAFGRLESHPIEINAPSKTTMFEISLAVMKDLVQSNQPTRAIEAAQRWLEQNQPE